MKLFVLFFIFSGFVFNELAAQTVEQWRAKQDSLHQAADFKNAILAGEQWKDAAMREGIKDTAQFARGLVSLASSYSNLYSLDIAEKYLALTLSLLPESSPTYPLALVNLGNVKSTQGKVNLADSLLLKGISLYEQMGLERNIEYVDAQRKLGDNYYMMDLMPEAERSYITAYEGWQKNGFQGKALINIYIGLYRVAEAKGSYREAEARLLESIRLLVEYYPPNSSILKNRMARLASLWMQTGKLEEADSCISQLMAEFEAEPGGTQTLSYAMLLTTASRLQQLLRNDELSYQYLQIAQPILANVLGSRHPKTIEGMRNLANLLFYLDRKDEARAMILAARDSLYAAGDPAPSAVAHTLVQLAEFAPSLTEAISLREEALQVIRKAYGDGIGETASFALFLGREYMKAGRTKEAVELLSVFDKYDEQTSPRNDYFQFYLRYMGQLSAERDEPAIALQYWARLAGINRDMVADNLFLLNDYQQLERVRTLQDLSNLFLSHSRNEVNRKAGVTALALDFQLFKKSLLLSAAQKTRENIQDDPALAPIFIDWSDVRERLAWAYTQPKNDLLKQKISVPALETRADSLEKILARQSAGFAAASLRQPFTWQDVQQKLLPGEAALEIARFKHYLVEPTDTVCYAIFIIRPGVPEPAVVFIEDGERFEQVLVEKYLDECASHQGEGLTAELYDFFWKKLDLHLQGISRLYVSGDGAFHKINLGAIRLPDEGYVADKYEIKPVFSLKDIHPERQATDSGRTAFLAGNPLFLLKNEEENATAMRSVKEEPGKLPTATLRLVDETRGLKLDPLPGSQQEVRDLSNLLQRNGWQTTVLTGETADEAAVKSLQRPRLVHLATHGYFLDNARSGTAGLSQGIVEKNPMLRSMLFFAGAQNTLDHKPLTGSTEDGILTAYEAQNLDLQNTELVVLSACQTARGKVQNGEGVYGLQRALRIAGAGSLLLTLWDVDDKIGQEFMRFFYEKWLGGSPKTEAFRWAQLRVKEKHPKPFYWAGFVLIGG